MSEISDIQGELDINHQSLSEKRSESDSLKP